MHRLVPTVVVALLVPVVAAAAAPKVRVTLGARVRLQTAAASVEIRRDPLRIELRQRAGRRLVSTASDPLFYERAGTAHALTAVTASERLADGVRLTVDTDEGFAATVTLRFLTKRTLEVTLDPPDAATVQATGARLHSPTSEHIYGLTERLRDSPPRLPGVIEAPIDDIEPVEVGSLDRRGETVEMRILPTFSVYAPFYISSEGYGLDVAGTTFGRFDLSSGTPDPQTVSFRFETASAPAAKRLVFRLFVGPGYPTILDEYTALNGRPFVPPDWAFLHWRWRGELEPDSASSALLDGVVVNDQLAEDVLMYEQLGIPPGVYLFDRPVLQNEYGFGRWAWDENRLPNPEAMLASLRDRGYHLMTWSSMWTCGANPGDNGFDAAALGFHVPGAAGPPHCADVGGTSFILDPTKPAAQAWWRDRIAAFMQTYGIRGIKLDRGEEHIPSEATDVYADGRTGREVLNDYPRLQAKIHYDALRQAFPDGDFVLFSRPGYTGTSQWSIFWGGDIPGASGLVGTGPGTALGLRSAIISQQRCAFMGIPVWGSDTGGYYEFKDREVFARWIEFSTFSGIMEIGGVGAHAPWDMPTDPKYDQELIDVYVRYTRLRATLQPYIVAAAAGARAGMPIVRPMPFFNRRDPQLADRWDQYLFGPDLLVAPVWKVGERRRDVYLPRGTWRSYWDRRKVYRGPRTISVDVPLDTIPVFVRGGARVPRP